MGKKVIVQYIRQPAFYKDFHCIGPECPTNCCHDWGFIIWKTEEYEKLINANVSETLGALMKFSFKHTKIENNDKYIINYNTAQKCPLLSSKGLCLVQKELGEEYLSETCRIYPRKHYMCDEETVVRTCNISCIHLFKTVFENKNTMRLELPTAKEETISGVNGNFTESERMKNPAAGFNKEIFDFFYDILSDTTRSIETSLTLAFMAAGKIDEAVKKGKAGTLPSLLTALRPVLTDPKQVKKLEAAGENISLRIRYITAYLSKFPTNAEVMKLIPDTVPEPEKWREGEEKFAGLFPGNDFGMRNVALGIFLAQRQPFADVKLSVSDNLLFMAAQMAVIKLTGILCALDLTEDEARQKFYIAASTVDRAFSHNVKMVKPVSEFMREWGVNSPAYLLGILK